MATEADQVLFENSNNPNVEPVLFTEKKTNFIVDSTSNGGDFSSGQITFDLSTFSSSNWQSLSEAVIEFPVKITAQLTTAAAGTPGNSSAGILSIINKNGYHQWINSAQLIINGQTIQSQQPYENVAASYRILSKWSNDTLTKWGTACGIALDDCTAENNVSYNNALGLNNAVYSTCATSVRGFDSTNNQTSLANFGTQARAQFNNSNIATTTVQNAILGVSATKNSGKSHVAVASATNTASTYLYTQFVMAQVRVKDLFDIDEFPLVKNIKGFMYLTFNSFKTTITGNAGGTDIASVTYNIMTGNSCPFTLNYGSSTYGIVTGAGSSTAPQIEVIGTVSGNSANAISPSAPLLTNARLLLPFYEASPNTDSALTKSSHMFKTLEKIVNPFTMNAGETKNITITVGVANPRKLVLLPMWQNLGGATLANPEQSLFDQTPATSGVFCKLDNIQVYVSNKGLFQYPVQYDYEYWVQEGLQNGIYSGKVDEISSGLLKKSLWESNHRYYQFDLSRRLPSDDGQSRSVQLTCTNPSATFGMKVIAILFYERKFEINTSTCQIVSG
jgi:hypothetical protein